MISGGSLLCHGSNLGTLRQNKDAPRAVLLNQGKHIPLLWQTLGNKYKDQIKFAIHRDRRGKSSEKMGLEKGEPKSSKVLLYPPGASDYVLYSGASCRSLVYRSYVR